MGCCLWGRTESDRTESDLAAAAGGSVVENPPPTQETLVRSLGSEDPLEKEMAPTPDSSWKIPWAEAPGRLQSMGSRKTHTRLRD